MPRRSLAGGGSAWRSQLDQRVPAGVDAARDVQRCPVGVVGNDVDVGAGGEEVLSRPALTAVAGLPEGGSSWSGRWGVALEQFGDAVLPGRERQLSRAARRERRAPPAGAPRASSRSRPRRPGGTAGDGGAGDLQVGATVDESGDSDIDVAGLAAQCNGAPDKRRRPRGRSVGARRPAAAPRRRVRSGSTPASRGDVAQPSGRGAIDLAHEAMVAEPAAGRGRSPRRTASVNSTATGSFPRIVSIDVLVRQQEPLSRRSPSGRSAGPAARGGPTGTGGARHLDGDDRPAAAQLCRCRARSLGLVSTVPATVARLARAWSLTVEAPSQPGGQTAWVAPVLDRATSAPSGVLKVGWAHPRRPGACRGVRCRGGGRHHCIKVEHGPAQRSLIDRSWNRT